MAIYYQPPQPTQGVRKVSPAKIYGDQPPVLCGANDPDYLNAILHPWYYPAYVYQLVQQADKYRRRAPQLLSGIWGDNPPIVRGLKDVSRLNAAFSSWYYPAYVPRLYTQYAPKRIQSVDKPPVMCGARDPDYLYPIVSSWYSQLNLPKQARQFMIQGTVVVTSTGAGLFTFHG
jgi:hypothetical protein